MHTVTCCKCNAAFDVYQEGSEYEREFLCKKCGENEDPTADLPEAQADLFESEPTD
jgi:peptide subunit release factor 1 (eRF1)